MSLSPAARDHVLAFADDEHCVGARHTAWIGLGPFLEEDLAFCSIAQDELGHAIGLYEILLDDAGDASSELDDYALMREAGEYRSCWLAEADCSEWNDSLVRHWLYDRAESLRWAALAEGSHERLGALAARAQREEAFHLTHAEQFMSRLGSGDDSGVLARSVERLLPYGAALWTPTAGEDQAIAEGIAASSSAELAQQWEQSIRGDLDRWGMDVAWPDDTEVSAIMAGQRSRTARSVDFAQLHADVQRVVLLDTAATW